MNHPQRPRPSRAERRGNVATALASAVLAGACSFTAIAESAVGVGHPGCARVIGVVPCDFTFWRTLQSLDADALDDAVGA